MFLVKPFKQRLQEPAAFGSMHEKLRCSFGAFACNEEFNNVSGIIGPELAIADAQDSGGTVVLYRPGCGALRHGDAFSALGISARIRGYQQRHGLATNCCLDADKAMNIRSDLQLE